MNPFITLLAGGAGTRFAPLSTAEKPKQFLHIIDSTQSLLRQSFERIGALVSLDHIFVSTNTKYTQLVSDQLSEIPLSNIIAEPFKKNTAPAIALITYLLYLREPESTLLFLPSDHYIHEAKKAQGLFKKALELAAQSDSLLTFGVVPEFPSKDYGYILFEPYDDLSFSVKRFVEKPNEETAQKYIQAGSYYWNSGIFVWRASVFLTALQKHLPQMYALLQAHFTQAEDFDQPAKIEAFFQQVESISIDYGLMEKADNVRMIPFDAGWSDVGTWQGLSNLKQRYGLKLPDDVAACLEKFEKGLL